MFSSTLWLFDKVVSIYIMMIFISALLSWFPRIRYRYRSAVIWLERVTNPVLNLCRRLLPPSKTGGMDLSPMIAILGIQFIWRILISVLVGGR